MADLDLIKISPNDILDLLKSAYYDQTGETIQIGSSEFAASAAQSYAWSVLLNHINEATRNRFIDDASGSFLDAIASNYGIESRPNGYHATAQFRLTLYNNSEVTIPAHALLIQDETGNQFTNAYETDVSPSAPYIVLEAVEAGTKYNGIPVGKLTNIVEGSIYISAITNSTMTAGGTDGFADDDEYREWLKTEIQSFSGAGTYKAYEARAKNSDSRVLDVYVLKQNQEGYEKGKVKIFIYTDTNTDLENQVKSIVQASCDDPSFRPIGDLVIVDYSALTTKSVSIPIQVTYPARFGGIADERNSRVLSEYSRELRAKINRPFKFEELCSRLTTKDADGVYAIDAKPLNILSTSYPDAIYPNAGGRLNIRGVAFSNVFSSAR